MKHRRSRKWRRSRRRNEKKIGEIESMRGKIDCSEFSEENEIRASVWLWSVLPGEPKTPTRNPHTPSAMATSHRYARTHFACPHSLALLLYLSRCRFILPLALSLSLFPFSSVACSFSLTLSLSVPLSHASLWLSNIIIEFCTVYVARCSPITNR